MKVHEYQARQLLSDAGLPVPPGKLITSIEEARGAYKEAAESAGTDLVVIKAQVHAGGRGKAGFVKLVRSADEAEEAARFMLSNKMVSVQTGPEGLEVSKLLIAAGVDIDHEYYLAITTDRTTRTNTLIASAEGGVEIEQVAEANPDAIIKTPIHPVMGLQPHQARDIAFRLGLKGKQVGQAVKIMLALEKLYRDKDCTAGHLYMLNSDYARVRFVPMPLDPEFANAVRSMGLTDLMDPVNLAAHFSALGKLGSSDRFLLELFPQLEIKAVNAHGFIDDISES